MKNKEAPFSQSISVQNIYAPKPDNLTNIYSWYSHQFSMKDGQHFSVIQLEQKKPKQLHELEIYKDKTKFDL